MKLFPHEPKTSETHTKQVPCNKTIKLIWRRDLQGEQTFACLRPPSHLPLPLTLFPKRFSQSYHISCVLLICCFSPSCLVSLKVSVQIGLNFTARALDSFFALVALLRLTFSVGRNLFFFLLQHLINQCMLMKFNHSL